MKKLYIRNQPFVSKKNEYHFDATTTQEKLALQVSSDVGMVCRYGDYVLMVDCYWRGGFIAAIYELIKKPDDADCDAYECPLDLSKTSEITFEDGGHAMAWALSEITNK